LGIYRKNALGKRGSRLENHKKKGHDKHGGIQTRLEKRKTISNKTRNLHSLKDWGGNFIIHRTPRWRVVQKREGEGDVMITL